MSKAGSMSLLLCSRGSVMSVAAVAKEAMEVAFAPADARRRHSFAASFGSAPRVPGKKPGFETSGRCTAVHSYASPAQTSFLNETRGGGAFSRVARFDWRSAAAAVMSQKQGRVMTADE
eukprot:2742823-Prymnesium_polylepis.1